MAGRVYNTFAAARKISPNINAGDGWAEVLMVPSKSPEFLFEVATLARVVGQIRQRVEALPENIDSETPLEFYSQVEAVAARFSHLPAMNMGQSLQDFGDAGLASIRACASTLAYFERPNEVVIDEDRLDGLRQAVNELIEDVEKSEDLDGQIRRILLRLLLQVRQALDEYRFLVRQFRFVV